MAVRIAPSILSADIARLGDQLAELADAEVDRIHVDVMDGHFVPPITLGPLVVEAVREATSVPVEAHLMVDRPEDHIDAFLEAGAGSIIVHQEAAPHLHRLLQRIRDGGARSGVALNPATPAATLEAAWEELDLVLAMTVNPGYAGQAFLAPMTRKIAQLRTMIQHRAQACDLEVDGGINEETAPRAVEAGADVLVAASAIFRHPEGLGAGVRALKTAAESATSLKSGGET